MRRPAPRRDGALSQPHSASGCDDARELFSVLVGDIYDASLDPTLWPTVLQKACKYIGGSAASLSSEETWRRTAYFYFAWGADPHYMRLYEEKYRKLNPAIPTVLFFGVEEPRSIVPDCITRSRTHQAVGIAGPTMPPRRCFRAGHAWR